MIDQRRLRSFWLLWVPSGLVICGFVFVVHSAFQLDQVARHHLQKTYEPVDEPSANSLTDSFAVPVRGTDQPTRRVDVEATHEFTTDKFDMIVNMNATVPTDSVQEMRPLGSSFKVDENGIIYKGGVPVGVWGVNGTSPAMLRTLEKTQYRR